MILLQAIYTARLTEYLLRIPDTGKGYIFHEGLCRLDDQGMANLRQCLDEHGFEKSCFNGTQAFCDLVWQSFASQRGQQGTA